MRICIVGLWHLGTVTAACLSKHFPVVGCDFDEKIVLDLQYGKPPILEPGLADLIREGLLSKQLMFVADPFSAMKGSDLVWITFDTPVDEGDRPNNEWVDERIQRLFPHIPEKALVLISSQVEVGFTRKIETAYRRQFPGRNCSFAYSPENLRLGKALDSFLHPERIVVGIDKGTDNSQILKVMKPFCDCLEWMSIESAEMTKHALNAFLATSIVFTNEIASICEKVGADAKEVERGLKSDLRIGAKAYVRPGSAFAGGTLARDLQALRNVGNEVKIALPLLEAVRMSNEKHGLWPNRQLERLLENLDGKTVAILGLTYKPETDTLRRSTSVELCRWLEQRGVHVRAYDPAIAVLPGFGGQVQLCASPHQALEQTDAAVIATEWASFKELSSEQFVAAMRNPVVLDANRFLEKQLAGDPRIYYIAVGQIRKNP